MYILAENIKKNRETLGLSQEELARKLNVSSQAVSKWELDENNPSIETLLQLSKEFNVSVDTLVTGVNDRQFPATKADDVNFQLKRIYLSNKKGLPFRALINDVVATIIPLEYVEKSDSYWTLGARLIIKATIFAMLEDKNVKEQDFNLQTIKKLLFCDYIEEQEFGLAAKQAKIAEYFRSKSSECRELIAVYVSSSPITARSMMTQVVLYLSLLTY